MKKNIIKKCPYCDSENIIIMEYLTWFGNIDQDKPHEVSLDLEENGIDQIKCANCDQDLSFIDNEFNFS